MEYLPEPCKDGIWSSLCHFLQHLATLLHELTSQFNRVLSRLRQEQTQYLKRNQLMHNLLVDQVCQHRQCRFTLQFWIPFECFQEHWDDAMDQQLS